MVDPLGRGSYNRAAADDAGQRVIVRELQRDSSRDLVIRSRIVGTGSFVPTRTVDNEEVAAPLGLKPLEIEVLTGIRTRHWAEPGQASSDLAALAGQRACAAAGLGPESIEAIVVSTTSPDSAFPSTACHVQRALGAKSVMAFDLSASCSGFLYGLSMADVMIRSKQIRSCLVIAAEIKSRSLNLQIRKQLSCSATEREPWWSSARRV